MCNLQKFTYSFAVCWTYLAKPFLVHIFTSRMLCQSFHLKSTGIGGY